MTKTIEERLDAIEKRLDSLNSGAKAPIEFVDTLIEYVGESNHAGIPWEGFDATQMVAIVYFLEDVFKYHDNK